MPIPKESSACKRNSTNTKNSSTKNWLHDMGTSSTFRDVKRCYSILLRWPCSQKFRTCIENWQYATTLLKNRHSINYTPIVQQIRYLSKKTVHKGYVRKIQITQKNTDHQINLMTFEHNLSKCAYHQRCVKILKLKRC